MLNKLTRNSDKYFLKATSFDCIFYLVSFYMDHADISVFCELKVLYEQSRGLARQPCRHDDDDVDDDGDDDDDDDDNDEKSYPVF